MKKFLIFVLAFVFELDALSDVIEVISSNTVINWSKGYIEISESIGENIHIDREYVDKLSEIKSKLKQELLTVAIKDIKKIKLDESKNIETFFKMFPDKYPSFLKLLYNAEIKHFRYYEGKIFGNLHIPIYREGLVEIINLFYTPVDYKNFIMQYEPKSYTGLIIDIRNFDYNYSMMPKIVSESGEIIYSYGSLSKEYFGNPLFRFFSSFDEVIKNSLFGDRIYLAVPLEIRGINKTDIVLSKSDILKLLSDPENKNIFEEGRIGIIVRKKNKPST